MAPEQLSTSLNQLQRRIEHLRKTVPPEKRILIALAGVPGSGKSTIAAALLKHLQKDDVDDVMVVPMDGFHYTKLQLKEFTNPAEAFDRRGAPFTFDAEAFVLAVSQLSQANVSRRSDGSVDVPLPSFDHATQDPVQDDIVIRSTTKIVILEGNYVLLDQTPWNRVATMAHERWFVDVPRDVVTRRLVDRHLRAGIERTAEAALLRVEANDLKNGDLLVANLIEPDIVIRG